MEGHALRPSIALLLVAVSFALLVAAGAVTLPWGLPGIVVAQVIGFAAPAWLVARRAGRPRAVLGVVAPRARAVIGSVLVAISLWYVIAIVLVPWVEDLVTEREVEELAGHLAGSEPLALKLIALAAVPAVCEELLFRGALARGLRAPLGLVGASLASAALFALVHGSLARLPITFALGVVLGLTALRTGSIVPAMVIHAGNNAAAVLLSWPPLIAHAAFLDRTAVTLPVAVLCSALGLSLLWSRAATSRSPS